MVSMDILPKYMDNMARRVSTLVTCALVIGANDRGFYERRRGRYALCV